MPSREAIKSFLGALRRQVFSRFALSLWIGGTIVATLTGPFGTFAEMGIVHRGVFWGVVVAAIISVGYATQAVTVHFVRTRHVYAAEMVAIAFVTLVLTPVIWAAGRLVQCIAPADLPSFTVLATHVLLLSTVMFMLRRVMWQNDPAAEPASEANEPTPRTPLLMQRLAPDRQAEILRLTANDHHIEVVTRAGSESIRMRLSDAVREMEPVKGFYIHRSHWVAQDAIVDVERVNAHKVFARLSNGDKVPVSRKYRPVLEEQGIL